MIICYYAGTIDHAIEIFVRAFAFTRGFTYPHLAERIGPVWVMRDAQRKRAADYRREEWVAHGVAPAEVDALARRETRGRFCVCAMLADGEPDGPIRDAYRSLGYRLGATEPFMVHRLARIPRLAEPFSVEHVMTRELADKVAKAAGKRQALPEHLRADSPLRLYTALAGDRPVGWVGSITVGDSTWVSNMFVDPKYRRRGIGRSMLVRMLRDDRAHGVRMSVLLSSHTGAMLYPTVGYERIGQLLLFTPRKQ